MARAERFPGADLSDAYSVNNFTTTPNDDGSVTVQFGGCTERGELSGLNYTIRLYRPRAVVLDGSWTFPGLEPA